MATQVAIATDQLWDHWPYLSHEQRLKQFRELHTGEKADFFLALDAHDQYNLLLGLPEDQRHVWMRLLAPDDAADVIQQADPEEREGCSPCSTSRREKKWLRCSRTRRMRPAG